MAGTPGSMKLRVKGIKISTGNVMVGILNEKDARQLDCHSEDRIRIRRGKDEETAIVDVTNQDSVVPEGSIGLFMEAKKKHHFRNNELVEITLEKKPESLLYIKKKLDGRKLTENEIHAIVKDIVDDKLSDAELTFFVAGTYTRQLDPEEIVWLTKAMVATGERLNLPNKVIMDKHCTGGVPGNRTTMVVVPIIAAAGLTMPKTSSRSITSPAGTADTVEVLTNVVLTPQRMREIVEKTNGCMVWGGSMNLAPADDKIIRVEKLLGIDAEGQLLSSVMAKKYSVGATHVLIDIPVGNNCKAKTYHEARRIRDGFLRLGKNLGMNVNVVLTDGSRPIGNGIGPYLEAMDVMAVLRNEKEAPQDLKEKAIIMAGILLEMAGKAPRYKGRILAQRILESGLALTKMEEIIQAQGKPQKVRLGKHSCDVVAKSSGIVVEINNMLLSKTTHLLGCPRNKGSGVYLRKKVGDKVVPHDVLCTLYAESAIRLRYAKEFMAAHQFYGVK